MERGRKRTYSVHGVGVMLLDEAWPRWECTRWHSRNSIASIRTDCDWHVSAGGPWQRSA